MEKTLESMFLKQYEDLQNELALANKRIEELEHPQKIDEPVVYKSISIEVCQLDVMPYWRFEDQKEFKDLTSSEIRNIINDDAELRTYAKLEYNIYGCGEEIVNIDTKAFPYSSAFQGKVILIDIYKTSSGFEVSSHVLGEKSRLRESDYFDIELSSDLYEYGLTVFKEELEKLYEKRLKKESENAQK